MKVIKWIGIVLGALLLLAVAAVVYFKGAASRRLARTFDVAGARLTVPYPLSEAEIAELPAEKRNVSDIEAVALERALARGKHYLSSRAGCRECHGEDFGGKVIVDNPAMGQWIAPNITRGGVTKNYRPQDWDRIVRHGVLPSGRPAVMPAVDFAQFSDQEVSDIAAYINSLPPVDRVMPLSNLGPVYSMLIATGKVPLSAEFIDHAAPRPALPPALAVSDALGKHLGLTCRGCHGEGFAGGPIPGGDPAWPPAKNITFDASGLAKWSLDDFRKAMKTGVRPDGSKIDPVMPISYTSQLAAEEVDALYLFLKSVPKRKYGTH